MLIDTHAHLNFKAFDEDRDEVIKRVLSEKVWMINVGTNYQTSKKAVEIAEHYQRGVFAAVGLHPINIRHEIINYKREIKTNEEDILEEDFISLKYKELAESEKVVALGEIGLDYWSRPKGKRKLELFKEKQKEIFLKQLALAGELNLPVIFHCRMAHQDLLKILTLHVTDYRLQGVVHCFTGSWEEAEKYLAMGFYLGFNGIIFKLKLDEVIKKTPLDRVLIETDCPFLAPPGFPEERNNPLGVKIIVENIAKIKGIATPELIKITNQNAFNLFNL